VHAASFNISKLFNAVDWDTELHPTWLANKRHILTELAERREDDEEWGRAGKGLAN